VIQVDSKLRNLEREAKISGDFAAYDAALARIGRKRITLSRETLFIFAKSESPFEGGPNDPNKPDICITAWSPQNPHKVDDIFECNEYECARVLEVEKRDLVVRLEQLTPLTAEQLNARSRALNCRDSLA